MYKIIKSRAGLFSGALFVLLMSVLPSCKKSFLEPEVKNNILETDVWSSVQNAKLFLNNIYTDFPTNHLLFDVATDFLHDI